MSDDRPVHTDALAVLGSTINDRPDIGRDAIHLAVLPIVAGENLYRGTRIGIAKDGLAWEEYGNCPDVDIKMIGIVDPFLEDDVRPGERFLMVLYPRTITSLRHVWAHPDVPAPEFFQIMDDKRKEERAAMDPNELWIRDYAQALQLDYDELMDEAGKFLKDGSGSMRGGDNLDGEYTSSEFWVRYSKLTGEDIIEDDPGNFFSCAC